MTEPERTDRRLAGTTALVTGGGRGLGRAIAQALGSAGAAVAIAARSPDELAATLIELRAAGTTAVALQVDVTDRAAVEAIVEQTERELGPIDLLVNNAGTCNAIAPVWEVDPDVWWREVEIHLRGSFLCARAVLPGMIARGRGRIINMASGVGLLPFPFTSAYSCGKAALMRLTDSLAVSTRALGVQVFAISPGNVRTAMMDHLENSEAGRRWLGGPERRAGLEFQAPERVAQLCVRLASGQADSLSGRYIHVTYDLDGMLGRITEIEQGDLYTLRLRVLPA
jgi:NAD(P)-dependent dehydrogenase (short-subunit alcohol dehydrogenase family)